MKPLLATAVTVGSIKSNIYNKLFIHFLPYLKKKSQMHIMAKFISMFKNRCAPTQSVESSISIFFKK